MRKTIRFQRLNPTPQINRDWFRSEYSRESGGILFELTKNGPGYNSDESVKDLGGQLVLPGKFDFDKSGQYGIKFLEAILGD